MVSDQRTSDARGWSTKPRWVIADARECSAQAPDIASRTVYRDEVATHDDRSLAAAIARFVEAPHDEMAVRFRAVLDALLESALLTGDDSVVETEDGEELLALFTSPVERFAFDGGGSEETMTGAEAIRRVAAGDYDGLVIDPSGRAFELAREEILE